MSTGALLSASIGLYAIVTGIFLISENRRPQSTLAWMLAFVFAPGIGVVLYILFGRNRKAFAGRNRIMTQTLESHTIPVLSPLLCRQDTEISRLESTSLSYRRLLNLVRQNSESVLTTFNTAEIQQNANVFYPSMISDLKAARHSIHLQYFIWRADIFGEELKKVLTAKARSGVEVRLLYDPLGSHADLSRTYVREMEAAGVRMVPTSPLYHVHTISYRNHRKLTVIDGKIGYVGGMNIGQEHLDGPKGYGSWRDTQLRIVGESAAVLQAVFLVDWYNSTKENILLYDYFPKTTTDERTPIQILTSGPDAKWEAIQQLYAFMIATARHHVYLQSPYFILDASIAEALRTAALSGIDVRVMVSAPGANDVLPGWAANTFMAEVVDAGVRVFLYKAGYLHAKTISIDSEICSIGSANIDIRSFSINYELNAVLYSKSHSSQLERDFKRDLANCTEFDLAEYRKRGVLVRFRDSIARLVSPLL